MLDDLTKAMFAENLDTLFQLQVDPTQTIAIKLVELSEGRAAPRQEQFALLFQGPLTTPFEQGLWPIHHVALGHLTLFLVPVRRDAHGMYYEAVFNRFLPAV